MNELSKWDSEKMGQQYNSPFDFLFDLKIFILKKENSVKNLICEHFLKKGKYTKYYLLFILFTAEGKYHNGQSSAESSNH